MKQFVKRISVSFLSCLFIIMVLSSCTPKPAEYATGGDDIRQAMNSGIRTDQRLAYADRMASYRNVSNALLPPLTLQLPSGPSQPQEAHFNVSANAMPASTFFMSLVAGTPYNMLVDPGITGTITLNLKNVTIDQALDAARELYGYEYQRTSLGYEILSSKMITQIFNVNYLNVRRAGQSQTQLVSTDLTNLTNTAAPNQYAGATNSTIPPASQQTGQNATQGSSSTVTTKEDNDFWANLRMTLQTLIGGQDGRWVLVNPQAGVVMVHAYPSELEQVSDYLGTIQDNLQREVIIEAKILEITLNDNYQAGINWKILGAEQNGTNGLDPSFVSNGQMFALAMSADHGNFSTMIDLLAQQGNIQVLSSPRISTINNQEAVIKVGSDQFFVTGYTSNITPTGSTNTTSQSVELNPFFSGITLDVTPQISADDSITLYIHPSISTVKDQNTTIQLSNPNGVSSGNSSLVLPLALSTIRESDNIVRAQNGQVVVIGGLMQNQTSEVVAGVPGLSKIPFVGTAARNTNQTSVKTELVILLRPIVVANSQTWANQLQSNANEFQNVQRGFHVGGLPEDFGTEGERNP